MVNACYSKCDGLDGSISITRKLVGNAKPGTNLRPLNQNLQVNKISLCACWHLRSIALRNILFREGSWTERTSKTSWTSNSDNDICCNRTEVLLIDYKLLNGCRSKDPRKCEVSSPVCYCKACTLQLPSDKEIWLRILNVCDSSGSQSYNKNKQTKNDNNKRTMP